MLEVYINDNHLEKGQNSICKEITEESTNCATGGNNLNKRLVFLKNRIRINAENLLILLGTSVAAIPNLDRCARFWPLFVKRDTAEAEVERRRAASVCGSAPGKICKSSCKRCNCFICSKDK